MSSWSCPHHEARGDACRRLGGACVLGRKGCVLPRKLRFAVDPEEQLQGKGHGAAAAAARPRRKP